MVLRKIFLVSAAVGIGVFALGCGNAKEADKSAQENTMEDPHAGHDHSGHDHAAHGEQTAHEGELVPQKTCPVMGNPINQELYVDHEGKRIYVCCEACISQVKENPEKYIEKLKEMGEKPKSM